MLDVELVLRPTRPESVLTTTLVNKSLIFYYYCLIVIENFTESTVSSHATTSRHHNDRAFPDHSSEYTPSSSLLPQIGYSPYHQLQPQPHKNHPHHHYNRYPSFLGYYQVGLIYDWV
jgi:hypothetical protein